MQMTKVKGKQEYPDGSVRRASQSSYYLVNFEDLRCYSVQRSFVSFAAVIYYLISVPFRY